MSQKVYFVKLLRDIFTGWNKVSFMCTCRAVCTDSSDGGDITLAYEYSAAEKRWEISLVWIVIRPSMCGSAGWREQGKERET